MNIDGDFTRNSQAQNLFKKLTDIEKREKTNKAVTRSFVENENHKNITVTIKYSVQKRRPY